MAAVGPKRHGNPCFRFREIGAAASRRVDGVDFRILAALHRDGTMSHAALGRTVGLTAPAVTNRLRRLRGAGILRGFRAALHPALFGRTGTMHVLPGPHGEADIDAALAAQNVVWVAWKIDGGMTVMAYGDADLQALGEVARTIPGERQPPRPPRPLAARVLAALVDDPRAGRDVLARRTGLSPKTCAKHRDALMEDGLLEVLPLLGNLSEGGAIVYNAAVFGRAPRQEVGAALSEGVLVHATPEVQYWFCMAPDYAAALQRQEAARRTGADVQVTMNRELRQNDARLQGWLGRIAQT